HVYRALIEATAFGTRVIVEALRGASVPVQRVVAGGGLTRNRLLMQIYADVLGQPIEVAAASHASALGAAMLGAVAAGAGRGGHPSVADAAAAMAPAPLEVYQPEASAHAAYDELFDIYQELYAH